MCRTLTINSDDSPLSGTTLTDEYRLVATEFGYDLDTLVLIARTAFTAALCDQALGRSLLDEWTRTHQSGSYRGQ